LGDKGTPATENKLSSRWQVLYERARERATGNLNSDDAVRDAQAKQFFRKEQTVTNEVHQTRRIVSHLFRRKTTQLLHT
jgi:hypothetical protein